MTRLQPTTSLFSALFPVSCGNLRSAAFPRPCLLTIQTFTCLLLSYSGRARPARVPLDASAHEQMIGRYTSHIRCCQLPLLTLYISDVSSTSAVLASLVSSPRDITPSKNSVIFILITRQQPVVCLGAISDTLLADWWTSARFRGSHAVWVLHRCSVRINNNAHNELLMCFGCAIHIPCLRWGGRKVLCQ